MPLGTITKTEVQLYTRDEVAALLRAGLGLVDELDPPEDLRAVVLEQAVGMIARKQVFFDQGGGGAADLARLGLR